MHCCMFGSQRSINYNSHTEYAVYSSEHWSWCGKAKVRMRNNGLIWSWVTLMVGMGNGKWEMKNGEMGGAHQSPSQAIHSQWRFAEASQHRCGDEKQLIQLQNGQFNCGLFSIAFPYHAAAGDKHERFDPQDQIRRHLVGFFSQEWQDQVTWNHPYVINSYAWINSYEITFSQKSCSLKWNA